MTFLSVKDFGFKFMSRVKSVLKEKLVKLAKVYSPHRTESFTRFLVNRFQYGIFFKGFSAKGRLYFLRRALFSGMMAKYIKATFVKSINPVVFNGCRAPKVGRTKRRAMRTRHTPKRTKIRLGLPSALFRPPVNKASKRI